MKQYAQAFLVIFMITTVFGCKNKNDEAIKVSEKTEAIIAKKAINDSITNNPPKGMVGFLEANFYKVQYLKMKQLWIMKNLNTQ